LPVHHLDVCARVWRDPECVRDGGDDAAAQPDLVGVANDT
jgi:hypothetical protein